MLSCLISVLVWAICLALLFYVVQAVAGAFSVTIPPPILTLIGLLLVVILVAVLLSCAGFIEGGPFVIHRSQ